MDTKPSLKILNMYSTPGVMTDPGRKSYLFKNLPTEISALCSLIQNNLIHIFWSERYGRPLNDSEKSMVNIRPIDRKLDLIENTDPRPLTSQRPLEKRQVGNCRDFSLMLTSILRYQGIPARARCGFGAYFLPDHYEDHWVCEYWNKEENRWILVDAQLDTFQCDELNVLFNPTDVPRDQFIVAGEAWHLARYGQIDPQKFGIFEWRGWWFIWGNVVRELLAYNKVEILPWDIISSCMTHNLEEPLVEGAELAFYDGIASLTKAGDMAFDDLVAIYRKDLRFQATNEILS